MKNYILNLFTKALYISSTIKKDKLAHFFAGSISLFLLLLFFNNLASISIVVIGAILKEIVWDDFLGKGNPEILDIVYGILPCAFYIINTVI